MTIPTLPPMITHSHWSKSKLLNIAGSGITSGSGGAIISVGSSIVSSILSISSISSIGSSSIISKCSSVSISASNVETPGVKMN